jgi:ribosomal 50S subunit-recycling heat shock protein
MPLLGAIGNASEYSFRGTYDNYPFDIDFNNVIDAEPGQIYITLLKLVEDINYKVPISITGDGEFFVGNIVFDKTFDNNRITLDENVTTFDTTFPELDYSTLPSYVRNANTVGLRIFGVPPVILSSLTVIDRSTNSYLIPLDSDITVGSRDGDITFSPQGSSQFDNRTFQGSEIGLEYYDKTYSTTITIGKKDFTWTVKTKKGGKAENLVFTDETDVEFSTETISDTYTVQGLTDAFSYTAEIISNEGLLSVNYGEFVNSATVKNGDIIRLKVTSSNLSFTQKTAVIRISLDVSPDVQSTTSWNVTTLDNIPSNLSFTDIPSAELNAEILSEVVTIEGLSNNINFNVSITSTDGLLSINSGPFVKSSTIKNGDNIQLRLNTTPNWIEEKTVTVELEDTIANWKVTNRTIEANNDPNADKLIYSIPFNSINQVQDMSPEVRTKSSLSQGLRASTVIGTVAGRTSPAISTERSRSYGNIGSYKLAKGSTTKTFEVTQLRINTDQTQVLGFNDFTAEMWMWFSGLNFGGEVGMSVFYPSYIDSRNANDYFFQLFVKGDNWPNISQFRRGLLLGYPDANGVVQTICETSSQVLSNNTWNHIALTRSGSTFRIWVNGINWASGSRSMDLTSKGYNFAIPNFQRLIPEDFYIQDLRLYKGVVKYTSNFNTSNVTPIMEPYAP